MTNNAHETFGLDINKPPTQVAQDAAAAPVPTGKVTALQATTTWLRDKAKLGQLRSEREARNAELKAAGEVVEMGMSPDEAELASRIAGRPLSRREILQGEIDKPDARDFHTRIRQDNFEPVMPLDPRSEIARELDEALREVEAERFHEQLRAAKTPAEQKLLTLKKMAADESTKNKLTEAQKVEHVKRAPLREKLEALEAKFKLDPRFTLADLVEVQNALTQINTFGSDENVCVEMAERCLAIEGRVHQDILEAAQARLKMAEADFQEMLALVGRVKEDDDTTPADPAAPSIFDDPQYDELRAKVDAANGETMEWVTASEDLEALYEKYGEPRRFSAKYYAFLRKKLNK